MCRTDRSFDPFAESTVDGIIAGSVEVKVSRTIKGKPCSFPCRIPIYHAIIYPRHFSSSMQLLSNSMFFLYYIAVVVLFFL